MIKPSNYPNPIDPNRTDRELAHFHSRYVRGGPDECWVWRGAPDRKGYGRIEQRGQPMGAHRLALVLHLGRDLGPGKVPNHMCGNPPCVNPAHLQESTVRENLLHGNTIQSENLAKTHCPQGHELTEANCTPSGWARGRRRCRTCLRAVAAKQGALIKAARKALGITWREYAATYGWSQATALAILRLTGRTA
jgi:DNA-binding transcriptional regulator YiaG